MKFNNKNPIVNSEDDQLITEFLEDDERDKKQI